NILLPFPFYTKQQGFGPAGSIISNINDLSNWLIAQMNGGKFKEKQAIPLSIIKETMQPASITASVPDKYYENMNAVYGMGRGSSIYKGHYRVQHTGAIGGIYSHISLMLPDSIGVIVFTNGAHAGGLPSIVANTVYDKVLDLEATPWSDRNLKDYLKRKMTDKESRQKPDTDRVPNTKPSHALADYAGIYEDAAYGKMEINYKNDNLSFTFNNTTLPLSHYHYDRFQSSDDEIDGKWTLRFGLDAQGSVQQVMVSMDEKEVVFIKKAEAKLSDPNFLKNLAGLYELDGNTTEIILTGKELMIKGAPPQHLEPYKGNTFKIREFSDQLVEFVFDTNNTIPIGFKVTYDGKSVFIKRKK
ncbi:MAG: Beta-lactamase precursor, partial [Bacteroidota bacterium]